MGKAKSRRRNYLPLGTIPSQLECPRCSSKLRLLGVVAAIPQMYICEKCGYRGPVGLEPGVIKIDNKKRI
jgi:DNA-directed RNA polymerase subunit RPC12/RpoP